MSKYNIGDTINLQLIVDDKQHIFNNGAEYWISVERNDTSDGMWLTEEQLDKYLAKTYEQGLEDAWRTINAIYHMTVRERKEVFCEQELCNIFAMTPQEALAKLEAYEKEQEEINVGDVVTIFPRSGGQYNAIVVYVKSEKYIDAIYSDGITTNNVPPKLYKKTGKHIDISSILEQIKE